MMVNIVGLILSLVFVVDGCLASEPLDEVEVKALRNAYLTAQVNRESKWLNYKDSVYVYLYKGGGKPNPNIAAFDIEGTIIKTHTGSSFPQHERDWEFLNDKIVEKLTQETRQTAIFFPEPSVGDKSRIVMFENQYGVTLGYVSLNMIKARVERFTKELNIPTIIFISIKKDRFRKPHDGMFRLFEEAFAGGVQVNLVKSFFVGDSAGEPAVSDYDIKFAQRIGLPFVAPYDYLEGEKPENVN